MMLCNLAAYLNPDLSALIPPNCESTFTNIEYNPSGGLEVTTLLNGFYLKNPDDLSGEQTDINQCKRHFSENPQIKLKLNLQCSSPTTQDKIPQYHFTTVTTTDNINLAKDLFYSFCKDRKKQLLILGEQKSTRTSSQSSLFASRPDALKLLIRVYNSESPYSLTYDCEKFTDLLVKMSEWPNNPQYVDRFLAGRYLQWQIAEKVKQIQQIQVEHDQFSRCGDDLVILSKNMALLAELLKKVQNRAVDLTIDNETALGDLRIIDTQLNQLSNTVTRPTLKLS